MKGHLLQKKYGLNKPASPKTKTTARKGMVAPKPSSTARLKAKRKQKKDKKSRNK